MYLHRYFLLLLILFTGAVFAQEDQRLGGIPLDEVLITAPRLNHFSSDVKVQETDSMISMQYESQSLGDLLQNESPVFIKSYGMGSLATTSFRGGSANHTAVLWNGFNINSPMNGITDFALIPNAFIGKVKLQYGGGSAMWGSDALGGTIHLNRAIAFGKGTTVSLASSLGSFSDYQQTVRLESSTDKWLSKVTFFHRTAINDFPFYNISSDNAQLLVQQHADLNQQGILLENAVKLNAKQRLFIDYWYQDNLRNIPPTLMQVESKADQADETHRATLQWQHVGDRLGVYIRTAYFDEAILYRDKQYEIDAFSRAKTSIAEAEIKLPLMNHHLFNLGLNNTYAFAQADDYISNTQQNRISAFASYRYTSTNKKWSANVSARKEQTDNTSVPFTYSAGLNAQLTKHVSLKASGGKVYRLPTFNDMYWNPGGNSSLLPENGYTVDAGMLLEIPKTINGIELSFESSLFSRRIENWIIWLPGQTYWSPQNFMEVWSRGMETNTRFSLALNELVLQADIQTSYVVSTNEKEKSPNDLSVGKQLIYVPMYSGNAKLSMFYKKMSISYLHRYTGYRYITSDNLEYLKPYLLGSVYASSYFKINAFRGDLYFQVNNLFKEQYEIIKNRPMPLSHYRVGVKIQVHKSKQAN